LAGDGNVRQEKQTMDENSLPEVPARGPVVDIRHLSPEQLAGLGVSQIAYVKPVLMNGVRAFAIHAADGTPMAVAGDCDMAVAAIHQHEMLASLVH
jgi:hypothetical protein